MSELAPVNFSNFEPYLDGRINIEHIGKLPNGTGVLREMAVAFEHTLDDTLSPDNLGQLIRVVGTAKTLQDNIGTVQESLGTGKDSVRIAQDWVTRSGLLVPVDRYFGVDEKPDASPDLIIITGGVRGWMVRRAKHLTLHGDRSTPVLLGAGNRVMSAREGADIRDGMTEAKYMEDVLAPKLAKNGFLAIDFIEVDSGIGSEVMSAVANRALERGQLNRAKLIQIVSNAGAWVQNAGQFREAARAIIPNFDDYGTGLSVVSDGFTLGTGKEPTSTHQNPYSALGQIARNFQTLAKHTDRRVS
jgi:hypothetical protein